MKTTLQMAIAKAIETLCQQQLLPTDCLALAAPQNIQIESPKDQSHGDFACNIALLLAKPAKQAPRAIAEAIVNAIGPMQHILAISIAGPGFINFKLHDSFYHQLLKTIHSQQANFGKCNHGQGQKVIVEYVSANPTGPLHVGHGRGAAFGSALVNCLKAVGYEVYAEYYVNDAGRQMDILTTSIWLRYLMLCGQTIAFPSNGYQGDYIIAIAQMVKQQYNDTLVHESSDVFANVAADESLDNNSGDKEAHIDGLIANTKQLLQHHYQTIHQLGLTAILEDIKQDLKNFRVSMDNWYSEKSLLSNGAIEKTLHVLTANHHTYVKDGATWFRASEFGDEKDRVLLRANGQHTYFTSDIAYHYDKFERGFDAIIDIFGADHHGYMARIRAALTALNKPASALAIFLVQFATLYRGKERLQMSTRSGSFITLKELYEEVGIDATRYFYCMRKNEQHMDFDLELAKSRSNENPVYYVQYAHARICSVMRQATSSQPFDETIALAQLTLLTHDHEKQLMRQLNQYAAVVAKAGINAEPHLITNYLKDLATYFHSYYNDCKCLIDDEKLRNARLYLYNATRQIIVNGLDLLQVTAPEHM